MVHSPWVSGTLGMLQPQERGFRALSELVSFPSRLLHRIWMLRERALVPPDHPCWQEEDVGRVPELLVLTALMLG